VEYVQIRIVLLSSVEFSLSGLDAMQEDMVERWNARAAVKHISAMVEDLLCLDLNGTPPPGRVKQLWQNLLLGGGRCIWIPVSMQALSQKLQA
jgi:hypothetical protein